MSKFISILLLVSIVSTPAFAFRKGTDDASIMSECLWNQKELGEDQVDCNDAFHHYLPKSDSSNAKEDVRIGSYNILRTSEQKDKKNLDLTAKMIDAEWDLVALQELQPGRTKDIIAGNKPSADYILPAYLELFLKLQEMDSTWGMIVSPYSQGSDSELLGYFYRGQHVKPVESEYCKKYTVDNPPYEKDFVFREFNEDGISTSKSKKPVNDRAYVKPKKAFACPIQLTELSDQYFIKVPLAARFKMGNFESSFISLHLSFRGIEEFDSACMGKCQLQNIKLISALSGDESNAISREIDKILTSDKAKSLLAGTELKMPDPEDRCQIDQDKLKDDRERETSRFNSCLDRLSEMLDLIKSHGFLPSSCSNIVKEIESESKYEKCQDDYEDIRDKAYKDFVKDVFKNVVFSEVSRIKKSSSQSNGEYLTSIFKEDVVTGMFNALGKDNLISRGEGRMFARFFQVFSVMQAAKAIRDSESTKDVMISGDFNLEKETDDASWQYHIWQHSLTLLGDAQLYIDGLTSINTKKELANNYDHFIMSPSETDECDPDSAYIFNFLEDKLSNGFDLGKAVQSEKYHFVMSDHLPIGITCSIR